MDDRCTHSFLSVPTARPKHVLNIKQVLILLDHQETSSLIQFPGLVPSLSKYVHQLSVTMATQPIRSELNTKFLHLWTSSCCVTRTSVPNLCSCSLTCGSNSSGITRGIIRSGIIPATMWIQLAAMSRSLFQPAEIKQSEICSGPPKTSAIDVRPAVRSSHVSSSSRTKQNQTDTRKSELQSKF